MTSPTTSRLLAITPKFTAFLSICGSLSIILQVLFDSRRRKKTMHRIMLGMSVCDFLVSIWYFIGTWAIPAGTLTWFGDGETETVFWAAGDSNGVSCSIAGFFNQFAVATPLYNCSLGIYYLLVVNYDWKDHRIVKTEWLFHAIPVGCAFFTSTFAAAANLYGPVEWTCWILPGALFDETQELTPIQRMFQWIQWIFLFGAVWTCISVLTVIFVILYRKMKFLERKMKRHKYNSTRSKSKQIAAQGMFYVGAFYVTWLFSTLSRVIELIAGKNYFPIFFLDATLIPLQGFFNFIIYIRPRLMEYQRQNKDDESVERKRKRYKSRRRRDRPVMVLPTGGVVYDGDTEDKANDPEDQKANDPEVQKANIPEDQKVSTVAS